MCVPEAQASDFDGLTPANCVSVYSGQASYKSAQTANQTRFRLVSGFPLARQIFLKVATKQPHIPGHLSGRTYQSPMKTPRPEHGLAQL